MRGQDTNTFRRSRTLTGSKSSSVSAANESRGKLQSDRLKKQSLRRYQQLLLIGLGGILIVIGGLYYLLSQYIGSAKVSYQPSVGLALQPETREYTDAIIRYLGARPAERFRFALDEKSLTAVVNQKHPEVASITSDKGAVGVGDFMVTFRQPAVSWKIGQKHYFVDNYGETFEKNFYPSSGVTVRDNSGAAVNNENVLASRGFLRFLGRLVALTNQSGLKVVEASLPPGTTRQIDLKLEGRGYTIKTHTDRDPAAIVLDIQRVINYLDQRELSPAYVDVRVPGRAYYK